MDLRPQFNRALKPTLKGSDDLGTKSTSVENPFLYWNQGEIINIWRELVNKTLKITTI